MRRSVQNSQFSTHPFQNIDIPGLAVLIFIYILYTWDRSDYFGNSKICNNKISKERCLKLHSTKHNWNVAVTL